ncbi:unnamed protein product, partial [marine sediment metagenome]
MFIDDKVADEIIVEQKKKMFDKEVKEYMKSFPDASKALAEEYATNQFKEKTEGKEAAVFPDFKGVLESAEGKRTKDKTYIQGHVTSAGKENFTILSNGKIQVQVNSDYLNMMDKRLPDAEIQLGKIPTDMISFVDKNNKIQAVLMPIRYDTEADLPFYVWDIPGGVKPTAEEIARKEKDLAEERRVKEEEGEEAFLERPGIDISKYTEVTTIESWDGRFDIKDIDNRRFFYNPKTDELVLGEEGTATGTKMGIKG